VTYVALALAGVLLLTTVAWAGLLRGLIRQHARERDLLVNQVMHLSGRTWVPPPGVVSTEPDWAKLDRYVASPEQLP
jgi:hypothetical protein